MSLPMSVQFKVGKMRDTSFAQSLTWVKAKFISWFLWGVLKFLYSLPGDDEQDALALSSTLSPCINETGDTTDC